MQYSSPGDRAGIEYSTTAQPDLAREALRKARAMLSKGDLRGAAEPLIFALDNDGTIESYVRASLELLLARLLAAQGHLEAAVERLAPLVEYIEDRRSEAHIYCARAVELATQGELTQALDIALRAAELAPSGSDVLAHVEEVVTVLVPAHLLTGTPSADISDGLAAEVLKRLIRRFKAAPNNLQLVHVIALLAERRATKAEAQALQAAIQVADRGEGSPRQANQVTEEGGAFDPWQWAIRCWVLLAGRDAYWQQWYRHLTESRGEPEHSEVDLRAVGNAALYRIRSLHERLREIYQVPDSPLHHPERAARHQRYLVALETESKGAQVLADLMRTSPDLLRSHGFVGPVAGTGLLAAIGRTAAIQQFVLQWSPLESKSTTDAMSLAAERLRQCLSPFSAMYTMHDMGWAREAELYCRQLADSNTEPRKYLGSLLCQQARAAFDGDSIAEARKSCVEALHLARASDEVLELFAKVSERRVQRALDTNRANFAYALRLAKQDLAEAPSDRRLKAVVARVLRSQAQHLRDLLGDASWGIAEARRIWALQNEAWKLDPNPELTGWTLRASWQLVAALVSDLDSATIASFAEAETVVSQAERTFAGEPGIAALRMGLLRTRVNWHLLDDNRLAMLRTRPQQIESLAQQVEQAWNLDRDQDEDDQRWTAMSLALLSEACLPAEGWPASLAPYNTALMLVGRGMRLVSSHPLLTSAQAEIIRLKANAIIHFEGGFDGAALSDAAKRTVINLFAQSWKLDASVAARALAIARACATIDECTAAEWYAHAAMMLEPTNVDARDLWALIRARPAYEAAVRDEEYAEQLIHQGRYRDAVGYLKRADQTLARSGYNSAWETFADLHRVVRHNLDLLRRSGVR